MSQTRSLRQALKSVTEGHAEMMTFQQRPQGGLWKQEKDQRERRKSSERWPFVKPVKKRSALVDEKIGSGRDHEKARGQGNMEKDSLKTGAYLHLILLKKKKTTHRLIHT